MSQGIIPCLSFPTTIVFVDDNEKFLQQTGTILRREWPCILYKEPKQALKFLKETYKPDPFTNRCTVEPFDIIPGRHVVDFNIRLIRNEAFNPNRSKQIATIVVDFAMPDMTGGELAEKLKGTPFKIILLTGEASTQTAVNLFNEGVIHSYIRKDDSHFKQLLVQAVTNLQQQYFQDISRPVFDDFKNTWPRDPLFKELINQVMTENGLIESYLADEYGSYEFLNLKGNPSFLAVANEEMMGTYSDYIFDYDVPAIVRNGIESKTMAPFFFNDEDFDVSPLGWAPYMHPVQLLKGLDNYYYSYIAKPNSEIYKSKDNILSYAEFLKSQG